MINNRGDILHIDSKVVIPVPEEDDTWKDGLITQVEDINDDGTIMFFDDEWNEHTIEANRVQLWRG